MTLNILARQLDCWDFRSVLKGSNLNDFHLVGIYQYGGRDHTTSLLLLAKHIFTGQHTKLCFCVTYFQCMWFTQYLIMLKTNSKLAHQNLQNVSSFYHLKLTLSKCGLCLTWRNSDVKLSGSLCRHLCRSLKLAAAARYGLRQAQTQLWSVAIWLTQPQSRRMTNRGRQVAAR